MSRLPIAVALMRDEEGRVLLVRKRGTVAFMQPGGKIEDGEEARACLVRELREELRIAVALDSLHYVGAAEAPAANEPGVTVAAEIFELRTNEPIAVQAEIEEAVWVHPAQAAGLPLAPLTRNHILPLARS